jgi:hypothetical protein
MLYIVVSQVVQSLLVPAIHVLQVISQELQSFVAKSRYVAAAQAVVTVTHEFPFKLYPVVQDVHSVLDKP